MSPTVGVVKLALATSVPHNPRRWCRQPVRVARNREISMLCSDAVEYVYTAHIASSLHTFYNSPRISNVFGTPLSYSNLFDYIKHMIRQYTNYDVLVHFNFVSAMLWTRIRFRCLDDIHFDQRRNSIAAQRQNAMCANKQYIRLYSFFCVSNAAALTSLPSIVGEQKLPEYIRDESIYSRAFEVVLVNISLNIPPCTFAQHIARIHLACDHSSPIIDAACYIVRRTQSYLTGNIHTHTHIQKTLASAADKSCKLNKDAWRCCKTRSVCMARGARARAWMMYVCTCNRNRSKLFVSQLLNSLRDAMYSPVLSLLQSTPNPAKKHPFSARVLAMWAE